MCNRFALPASPEQIASHFELDAVPQLSARYNVAPGEPIAIVHCDQGRRTLGTCHWGLIPPWVREARKPLLNIRSETLRGKPGLSEMARTGRCLVPASGFFEWRRLGRTRQPYYFHLRDSPLLGLAALVRNGREAPAVPLDCAVLTTEPNSLVAEVHDRMPVIVPPEAYGAWLDASLPLRDVAALLAPLPAERMEAFPVSSRVNRAGIDDPTLIERVKPGTLF